MPDAVSVLDPRSSPLLAIAIVALATAVVLPARGQNNATLANATASTVGTNSGPRIEFAETMHDFGRVESGKEVHWDFAFTNIGTEALEIKNVKSSCGCTTLGEATRRVEPGKSGIIPVQFNSGGMAGPVMKNLFLACNDPSQSNVVLYFTAMVWKPIDAIPVIASFYFGPDFQTNQTRSIRLVSNLDGPVALSEPVCTNAHFRAELKTLKEGREFELLVTVIPPLGPGSWLAPVTMKSSSPTMPEVKVSAYAMVQPAVMISPPRIVLPPGPLANPEQSTVIIQSASTNALVLSEASVNVQGATVHLQEVQPGRLFNLSASFPAGFKAAPDQQLEVRLKSNHPQVPLLQVPVSQMERADDSPQPGASPAGGTNAAASQATAFPAQAPPITSKPMAVQK